MSSVTSASEAGCHFGERSLSISAARTPSRRSGRVSMRLVRRNSVFSSSFSDGGSAPFAELAERHLEAQRRALADDRGGFARPIRMGTGLGIEAGENGFDAFGGENPVDGGAQRGDLAFAGMAMQAIEHRVDRVALDHGIADRVVIARIDAMGGDTEIKGVGASEASPGQSRDRARSRRESAAGRSRAPISGKRPMPVSGIAASRFAPATRCVP